MSGYGFSKFLVLPPSLTRLVSVPPQTSLGGILAAFLHLRGGRRGGERQEVGCFHSTFFFLRLGAWPRLAN